VVVRSLKLALISMDVDNSQKLSKQSYWTLRRKIKADVAAFLQTDFSENHDNNCDSNFTPQGISSFSSSQQRDLDCGNVVEELEDYYDCLMEEDNFESDSESESASDMDEPHEPHKHVNTADLSDFLRQWIAEFNIPHVAASALLKKLRILCPDIPRDARTLLRTPKLFNVVSVEGDGEYVHIGVRRGVEELYEAGFLRDMDRLELQFSIDGLPLFKSSSTTLWPILCLVKSNERTDPFVVGMFCGKSKPTNVEEFLAPFVREMQDLLANGIELADTQFAISIHSFIADAPARAMLRNVKGHNSYYGCDKCEVEGEWHGKMTYQELNARRRTDSSFIEGVNEEHHIGPSPLRLLPIGLVSSIPLDYMHLCCLGVMRRLILCWLRGPLNTRIQSYKVRKLSDHLMSLACNMPREFARRPRSTAEIKRWKATELRMLLFYTGPVVLRNILSETLYEHFLLLFVGLSLLSNPNYCSEYCDYANDLLETFVKNASILYGKGMLVYNFHSLIHLAEDCKKFGKLHNFSAFPFENALKGLKKLVRKPNQVLQQLVGRLAEKGRRKIKTVNDNIIQLKKEHESGPVPNIDICRNVRQYEQLHTGKCFIAITLGDNCFMTEERRPCLVRNILCNSESVMLAVVEYFSVIQDFFHHPLPSSQMNIFHVSCLAETYDIVPVEALSHKFVCMPSERNGNFILIPLNHVQ
jgi:hypothetical protein